MSYEENEDDIFVPEENKKDFVTWTQNFCWWNWEISLGTPGLTEEQRLESIEKAMEGGLMTSEELDGAINSEWLTSILNKNSKHDEPDHWFFTGTDISDIVNIVSQRMASESAEELVKQGEADLLWDAEKNDFVIRMKEK